MENNSRQNISEVHNYVCQGCGANMKFDPESQTLKCEYCNNSQEVLPQDKHIREYDFKTAEDLSSKDWGSETKVVQCTSCGSEVVFNSLEVATKCSFCGSAYTVKNEGTIGIAPESLIPFKISDKKANEMFSEWIKKRPYAPEALRTSYKNDKMNGIYIPFWTYDVDTISDYSIEVGNNHHITENYVVEGNTKKRTVKKMIWKTNNGKYSKYYDDILINASKQIDEKLMKELEPFHLEELVAYDPKFLSGFAAEKYSIGLKEGWENAKRGVDEDIMSYIKENNKGEKIGNINISTSYNDIKFKHILVPVWISSYTYKNKVYRYIINGQTGEVQGDAPTSLIKLLLGMACLIAIGYFILRHYK
ncbi:hypothetical protein [Clostridium sp. 'White wine YQ']|uniref:hypothetical protein n=1 Tax=Clostridium sp. 'White wine YQ' TaxID=3027474 RepID=UPI002366D0FE|nr:hypothetical protein [Clostridium sp. 'White wine YQ']MDD7795346.1 hypothetical protein [Clostridium sp. 'White wine YQ']